MNYQEKLINELNDNLENSYMTATDWLKLQSNSTDNLSENFLSKFNYVVFTVYQNVEDNDPKIRVDKDKDGKEHEIAVYNKIEYPLLQYCLNRMLTHNK